MASIPQVSKNSPVTANVDGLRAHSAAFASAGVMMAFFGAMWWVWGVAGIRGVFRGETAAFFLTLACATIILVGGGTLLSRAASREPHDASPAEQTHGRAEGNRYGMTFGAVFGIEMVTIALGSILLNLSHHTEFILPFVSIVVGMHFFPLARLFEVRVYYATGALLVLVGVAVMLAVPVHTMIGNLHAWNALVGSICAVILWLTGIAALLRGRSFLKQARGQG